MSDATLQSFITELSAIAVNAESLLGRDLETVDFARFSKYMIAIRGTADQLGFPDISSIAGLGEEIAIKAALIQSPNQIRKCLSGLWDAVTTVKYLLQHLGDADHDEQAILVKRLESVLHSLGGKRETVSADEIAELLRKRT
jgi:hypothetical protein